MNCRCAAKIQVSSSYWVDGQLSSVSRTTNCSSPRPSEYTNLWQKSTRKKLFTTITPFCVVVDVIKDKQMRFEISGLIGKLLKNSVFCKCYVLTLLKCLMNIIIQLSLHVWKVLIARRCALEKFDTATLTWISLAFWAIFACEKYYLFTLKYFCCKTYAFSDWPSFSYLYNWWAC